MTEIRKKDPFSELRARCDEEGISTEERERRIRRVSELEEIHLSRARRIAALREDSLREIVVVKGGKTITAGFTPDNKFRVTGKLVVKPKDIPEDDIVNGLIAANEARRLVSERVTECTSTCGRACDLAVTYLDGGERIELMCSNNSLPGDQEASLKPCVEVVPLIVNKVLDLR